MDIAQRLIGNRGWGRMLRMLWVAAVAIAAAGWCSTAAWAANASDLSIVLSTTPTGTVTLSRENLPTYVAYRGTLTNSGPNTINQVRLTGDTTANGTTQASYYGVVGIAGIQPACAAAVGDPSLVNCTVGQMRTSEFSDFFLIFVTPSDGSNLHVTVTTTFSEAASSTSKPANVVGATLTSDLALTTRTTPDINVHTALPPVGGRFFTGPNGAVNGGNPFSSDVSLPGVAGLVTNNRIDLTTVPSFPCDVSYYCFGLQSTINVNNARDGSKVYYAPGQSITIVLRQDISTLSLVNGKRKLGDVKIFYQSDPNLPLTFVPACTPALPTPDHPCISARFDYTSGNTGWYEYWIRASDNGVYWW